MMTATKMMTAPTMINNAIVAAPGIRFQGIERSLHAEPIAQRKT
jgi:hypothetical protein